MRRRGLLIGGAAVVGAVVAWYLFRPELLVIDARVSEAFPAEQSDAVGSPRETVLAQGTFHSVAHESKGVATIHQLSGSARLLRLTEFETSNGPALHVYLVG